LYYTLSLCQQKEIIMTTKEILIENRESVISSIKWIFKVWKSEDVKVKMIEFLAFCEENMNAEEFAKSKRIKTDLKNMVSKMASAQEKASNLKRYGTERPKLADIMAFGAELHEQAGEVWNPMLKDWVKNEGFNPTMRKY